MSWQTIRDDLAATSVKQRLVGLEALLELAGQEQALCMADFAEFVDQCSTLLTDSNFKVVQQTLHALSMLVCKEPDAIKPYANSIIPLVAERLADARQQVRQDACEVLLKLLAALKPETVIPRMARFWSHRSWKVRHGVLQTLAEAVATGIPALLNHKDQNNYIITQVVNLVEDPNETVRDAALDCLQELFRALGPLLVENLRRQSIRPAALREVVARLEQISPCSALILGEPSPSPPGGGTRSRLSGDAHGGAGEDLVDGLVKIDVVLPPGAAKTASNSGSSAKRAAAAAGKGGQGDAGAGAAGVVAVCLGSEREMVAEFEAMASLLSSLLPDWQLRIASMARLEGIVRGSPQLLEVLPEMLKMLRDALTKQVEDRRSAVNKQACQTLTALSQVLGSRFQEHAVYFLPVLFKVLPITVQVMAESADACCRAILQSCQSHRLVPVLVHAATKDKNNKIRALCCGYLALILESWEAGVWLRCAEELEAAIRCAAQDASGEARQAARRSFAAYVAKAPEHAQAMLQRLDSMSRDKLAKAGISLGPSGGPEGRRAGAPAPTAAAARRKPTPGFVAAAKGASAGGASDVMVFMPERPAAAVAAQEAVSTLTAAQPAPAAPRPLPGAAAAGAAFPLPPAAPGPRALHSAPGAGAALSQRGPYRSSASDLPPTDRSALSAAAGRKSLGFGPARVPDPSADALSAAIDAAAAPPPRLKSGRRSTGGIGCLGSAFGSIHHPAVRVPSAETHSASASDLHAAAADGRGGGGGGAAMQVGSPARRVSVSSFSSAAGGYAIGGLAALGSSGSGGSWGGSSGGSHAAAAWGHAAVVFSGAPASQQQQQQQQVPLSTKQSIAKVVSGLMSGSKTWNEKVQALSLLTGLLEQMSADSGRDQGIDCGRDLEKLSPRLVEYIEDSHHKVAGAAMEALRAAVRSQPRALDPAMERLLPVVFQRSADPKDSLKALAAATLADCSASFPADVLLLGLARALETNKLPRTRASVMEFCCQHIGQGRPAGVPSNGTLTKQWLRLLCTLLTDKNLDLRRSAADAVEALYQSVDAGLVMQYASFCTGPEALALKRVLSGLSGRCTGAAPGPGPGPDAMEVDEAPPSAGPRDVTDSPELQLQRAVQEAEVASGVGVGAGEESPGVMKLAYVAAEYMTPQRVDVERMADVGPVGERSAAWPRPAGGVGGEQAGASAVRSSWSGSEVAAAARHVSLLVYRVQTASGPEEEAAAWSRLTESAGPGVVPAAAWEGCAAQLRLSLGRGLRSASGGVRAAAGRLAAALAVQQQPSAAQRALLEAALPALLEAAAMEPGVSGIGAEGCKEKEAAKVCFDVLVLLIEAAPAQAALELLTQQLPADPRCVDLGAQLAAQVRQLAPGAAPGPPPRRPLDELDPELLSVLVRCMHSALRRLDLSGGAAALQRKLVESEVVPGLLRALGHARADIRKGCVFCLVELWCKMGDALPPLLVGLSDAQRKLVAFYYRRASGLEP